MPFSESLKLEVKRKSAFRCCLCHDLGIEVHHIISEKDKGPSTFKNAAPLCPSCHNKYGNNPDKRKFIGEMRGFWYQIVEDKYPERFLPDNTEKINDLIVTAFENPSVKNEDIEEIKKEIKEFSAKLELMAPKTPNELRTVTNEAITATRLASNIHVNFQCRKCKTFVGLLIGSSNCPTCGEPIPN